MINEIEMAKKGIRYVDMRTIAREPQEELKAEPRIPHQLKVLQQNLEIAAKQVSQLGERLNPIMGERQEEKATEEPKPVVDTGSELSNVLLRANNDLGYIIGSITDILMRIEL